MGLVREVVETVLLAVLTAISLWMGSTLIEHGKSISAHGVMLNGDADRLTRLEEHGSARLDSYMQRTDEAMKGMDKRVEKLEAIATMTTPMVTKVDYLVEGQKRLERLLEEHIRPNSTKTP